MRNIDNKDKDDKEITFFPISDGSFLHCPSGTELEVWETYGRRNENDRL
jgi:hypothetical protein